MANTVNEKSEERSNVKEDRKGKGSKERNYNKGKGGGRRDSKPSSQRNSGSRNTSLAAQRVHDATALNFNSPVFATLGVLSKLSSVNPPEIPDRNVFIVHYMTTLGNSVAANLSSQKVFGELRRVMNVPTRYEAGDLFMYMMATESLAEAIYVAKRVVKLANTFKTHNFLYPKAILEAMGWDIDEIIEKDAQYREAINKALNTMKYVGIPLVSAAHSLRVHLNESIFIDEESPKAQNVIFMPEGHWMWNLASGSSTAPSDLTFKAWTKNGNGYYDVSSVKSMLTSLANALITDQEGQLIHGDILKVWGDSANILGGEVITEFDYLEPEFNPYILYMLHNATIDHAKGSTDPTISWNVPSGGGSPTIEQHFYVNSAKTVSDIDILDVPTPSPDDEMVMDMCRWKHWTTCQLTDLAGSNNFKANAEVGTAGQQFIPLEILCKMEAITFDNTGASDTTDLVPTVLKSSLAGLEHVADTSVLRIRPIYYIKGNTASSGSATYVTTNVIGDRTYNTTVDDMYVQRLNDIVTEANYGL